MDTTERYAAILEAEPDAHPNGATPEPEPEPRRVSLSRDAWLAPRELPIEWVAVPEWGPGAGTYVRGMTAGQLGRLDALTIDRKGRPAAEHIGRRRATIVAWCACDAAGARTFADSDVTRLMNLPSVVTERVLRVANRLSGIRGDEEDDEGAAGNSGTARSSA